MTGNDRSIEYYFASDARYTSKISGEQKNDFLFIAQLLNIQIKLFLWKMMILLLLIMVH